MLLQRLDQRRSIQPLGKTCARSISLSLSTGQSVSFNQNFARFRLDCELTGLAMSISSTSLLFFANPTFEGNLTKNVFLKHIHWMWQLISQNQKLNPPFLIKYRSCLSLIGRLFTKPTVCWLIHFTNKPVIWAQLDATYALIWGKLHELRKSIPLLSKITSSMRSLLSSTLSTEWMSLCLGPFQI